MQPHPPELTIMLDASWPASVSAAEIQDVFRRYYDRYYGSGIWDFDRVQLAMNKIWVRLHDAFTDEELLRIDEITHISIPIYDLSASIIRPLSRQGYFIMFDAILDLRISELFTAPRYEAAWAACYIRAAWGSTQEAPYWLGPRMDQLRSIRTGPFQDAFSKDSARDFIFAHECGHFYLDNLSRGSYRKQHFSNQDLLFFDPKMSDEIDADRFARDLLCRKEGYPLPLQQMGIDWLFG